MKKLIIAALTVAASCVLPAASLIAPQTAAAQWVEVGIRPPEPRVEVRTAAPAPGYVWVPGYWNWDGRAHVWVGGRWEQPRRASYVWHEPVWRAHGHGWRFHRGHWGHR